MTFFTRLIQFGAIALCTAVVTASSNNIVRGLPRDLNHIKRNGNQSIVSWDAHSLFVHGERVHFWSGEFHSYRLPSPSLWLDILQKIKALGYNGVSIYFNWSLLEGQPGIIRDTGIFALEPFFAAALQAGIYVLARPGPYINAESSGGGFPGWLQGINGQLRTNESAYIDATKLYISTVLGKIAAAQITNGGPVILVQVENEYADAEPYITYPDYTYWAELEQMFTDAGIVVPFTNNEIGTGGQFAPGTRDQVDIYGYDLYPLGFDCSTPYNWGLGSLRTSDWATHLQQDPGAPHFIPEFQGGSFDPWGGYGFGNCTAYLGPEFERVFYKNQVAEGVTMQNMYMTYGGTNWGNSGYPTGYTSYDYGAAIAEDRTVARQKYSEAKLVANFLQATPALLSTVPGTYGSLEYTNTGSVVVTPLMQTGDTNAVTQFFVTRQAVYNSLKTATYQLILPTSKGNITIPQLGGNLTIIGRDTKIHVTDYNLRGHHLLYSTADIFTWGKIGSKTVLVVYGEISETHEMAFTGTPDVLALEDADVHVKVMDGTTVINWQIIAQRNVVKIGNNLFVYMLPRQQAYEWWSLPISKDGKRAPSSADDAPNMIAGGGYLLRNVTVNGGRMSIYGDLNATTLLEIVLGAPQNLQTLKFNGQLVTFTQDSFGRVQTTLNYTAPVIKFPDFQTTSWSYIDSLPEIQPGYDDSAWPNANKNRTANIDYSIQTPTTLFSADYGFHCGSFLFRGHFVANGQETTGTIQVQGGSAFGFNLWLNSTLIGTYTGVPGNSAQTINFNLPTLTAGAPYVMTILQDMMGYEENGRGGDSGMKTPRGIISYSLAGHAASDITWKITGNLGGQNYTDLARGPLNEGGMFAERQGYHFPAPPVASWAKSNPTTGITTAGVRFYSTNFTLNIPQGYDTPLSFVFSPSATPSPNFRVQLFVNGYQFGKYINNIGPQKVFPVPEGVLNHRGLNYVAITLWAQDAVGAKLGGFALQANSVIQSGMGDVVQAPQPAWTQRPGAY